MFQYAFLRVTAERLGVKFFCPPWMGDDIFLLNDEKERVKQAIDIDKTYIEPIWNVGFNEDALGIEDGTEIEGYFQTEKYYPDSEKVRGWYTLRGEKIATVEEKYKHIDFSRSVGLHLRFGDIKKSPACYVFYIPSVDYYVRALSHIRHKEKILVFSDEIESVKKHLKKIGRDVIYIEGNKDYEDLHLMSLCHDFICSGSTFSWWGAWLNSHLDKTIVVPKEGAFRPACPKKNDDFWPDGWIRESAAVGDCPLWIRFYFRHMRLFKLLLKNFNFLIRIFLKILNAIKYETRVRGFEL